MTGPAVTPLGSTQPLRVEAPGGGAINAAWRTAWDALAQHASEPNPFAERWFVEASLDNLAKRDAVHILGVWEGAELIGIIPLTMPKRYGRLPVRHVENWIHYHSFVGTPLIRAGSEADFWRALLDALDHADWARGFLHLTWLVENGPVHTALRSVRRADTVWRSTRALLHSTLDPQAYYEATVRKKKRKEINRLKTRLAELGEIRCIRFDGREPVDAWCDAFLALEASGWKGEAGSALGCATNTARFFRDAIAGAAAAGRIEMLRLDVAGKPIAMLVNFLTPPGSFSFKIAFDEDYARFSPGVLIQLENLDILNHKDIDWMDSCAVENHPMINSLWGERRTMIRVTVPLAGWRRRMLFSVCRAAETLFARIKRRAPALQSIEAP